MKTTKVAVGVIVLVISTAFLGLVVFSENVSADPPSTWRIVPPPTSWCVQHSDIGQCWRHFSCGVTRFLYACGVIKCNVDNDCQDGDPDTVGECNNPGMAATCTSTTAAWCSYSECSVTTLW